MLRLLPGHTQADRGYTVVKLINMTQTEDFTTYLSTLNHLCKKFPDLDNAPANHSDEEESVSELIDLLKIHCGEKIVFDFDNEDGWTWRDEHSGPFSWMTRSQQDLTEIGSEVDVKCVPDQQTPRKNLFPVDDSDATRSGLSEIQAAFQKFGLNSVDESEMTKTTTAEIERIGSANNRKYSLDSNSRDASSPLSSPSVSPVHEATSTPSFSPAHQPDTPSFSPAHQAANVRKWSAGDCSDTEAEQSLIDQAGHMTNSFVIDPPEEFQSVARRDSPVGIPGSDSAVDIVRNDNSLDIAGVHSTVSEMTLSKEDSGQPLTTDHTSDRTSEEGYVNSGIDLGTDLLSESTTEIQKTGFDFLDNW